MSDAPSFEMFVHEKLARIFGEKRARELVRVTLRDAQIPALKTAEDLLHFGRFLERRGGFEGAVGAMLTVHAVLKGARE